MIRWGRTAKGVQRWRCNQCEKSACRRRPDTSSRNHAQLQTRWLSKFSSLADLALKRGIHRTTLSRRFGRLPLTVKKVPLRRLPKTLILVLDGTKIAVDLIVLIAYEHSSDQPLGWAFVERERFDTWHWFLREIKKKYSVRAIVSDGQKGLKKAITALFPNALHQRCIAHVVRLSLAWLTKHPQSEAGKELRSMVCVLRTVKTRKDAVRWSAGMHRWDKRHTVFLSEKSINPLTGRRWYTHRKLRAVRSLVLNALPDLFHYAKNSRVPNTTNSVEGGINSPLKELLGRHRGITKKQKELLVSQFLYNRRKRKTPTRNAT